MIELYKALLACKRDLGPKIHVDSKGQYGSYVSLEQVLAIVEPVAQKHGILILQYPDISQGTTHPCLVTRVVHVETGDWIAGTQLLTPDKAGPQGLGACETYARRRTLMDIFGLASEGDPDAHPQQQQISNYVATGRNNPRPPAVAPQAHRHQSTAANYSIAAKEIKVGKKFKGVKYGSVPLEVLLSYGDWLKKSSEQENKPLSATAEEFLSDVAILQLEATDEGPGRDFAPMSDDQVPF